jgi:glycosyltransferase involved in cell wall biosynthesis
MNFSVVIPVFNEQDRIIDLLDSIIGRSNDVVIINKNSTDKTKELISNRLYPNVRIIDYPYSEKGIDDFASYCAHANNNWIFVCVASETVPSQFWYRLNEFFKRRLEDSIDVLMVPRNYYCFGVQVKNSPWDVSYFPFFFHKQRVIYSDKLHEHFTVCDEARRHYLHCNRSEMILHLTHPTVDNFIQSAIGYADIDCDISQNINVEIVLKNYMNNIREAESKLSSALGSDAVMHFAAWNVYWSIYILKTVENYNSLVGATVYNRIRKAHFDFERAQRSSWGTDINFMRRPIGLNVKYSFISLARWLFKHNSIFRILINKIRNR